MPRNVVVLLDNSEGRAMIKEACKTSGLLFSEFEELSRPASSAARGCGTPLTTFSTASR